MKKLLTVSVLMLTLCGLLVCTVPAYATMSIDSTITKIWNKNGDCEIKSFVAVDKRRRDVQSNHGYYAGMEVRYSRGGRSNILLIDLSETRYGAGEGGMWMQGTITIPQAYLADFQVTIHVGYSRSGADRVQEYCDSINIFLDEGILRPDTKGKTTFEGCTQKDIERLITEGDQDKRFWTSRKDNPPRVSLDSYNYSGDWTAGTFTQTFTLGFNVVCKDSPRSFSIKIKYFANEEASRPGFAPVEELEEIKITLSKLSQPKTITVTIPQTGLSRHSEYSLSKSPIFVRELSVIVTESVTGHDQIVTFYELKIGAKVTIN